jgi:hypothetical protein
MDCVKYVDMNYQNVLYAMKWYVNIVVLIEMTWGKKMDNYTIDYCKGCSKYTSLKNDLCITCNEVERLRNLDNPLPDFLKDLFRKKNNDS